MTMKKQILFTLLCILGSVSMQAADYQYLVFTKSDGTLQAVTASNLTFNISDGTMTVVSGTETVATLTLSELTKMEFSTEDPTGISEIYDSVATDSAALIYDTHGRLVATGLWTDAQSRLPRGIYIVKSSGKTVKLKN